mgnify:FL=1
MKGKITIFHKEIPLIVVYTICFLVISFMTFGGFVIFGRTLIINAPLNTDGVTQHYPLLVNMKHIIQGIFQGKGISFCAQNIGLGNDLFGNAAIVLMDPFNYLAILFPEKYLDIGYSLAIILRLYCAGLAMCCLLRYHKKSEVACLLGGLSYAFSGWAISAMAHAFFLNPLVLFPIVILGIDKIFNGEKPYTLIFSVWLSLITYIYFAYMTAIYAVIYILVRYFAGDRERKVGDFFQLIFKYVFYVIIAVFLASPVMLSVLYAIVNAAKTSGVRESLVPTMKQLLRWIPSLACNIDVARNYTYSGTGALTLVLVPLMFTKLKDKNKRVPIFIFFFSFLMLLVSVWGRVMNGFSYSAGRWCYILAFFYVWSAMEVLDDFMEMKAKEERALQIWLGIVGIFIFVGIVLTNILPLIYGVIAMVNIVFAIITYSYRNKRMETLISLVVLNIGIGYAIFFSPFSGTHIDYYTKVGECWEEYSQSVLRADNHSDKDYYRIDSIERVQIGRKNTVICNSANESLFWNTRTVAWYLSTMNKNLLEYNKQLGNNTGYFRRMIVWSNDNRSSLNFLQGVKYFLNESGSIKSYAGYGYKKIAKRKGVTVQKQKYKPGLGYVFDSVIKESEFEKYSALEKEQLMMQTAVVSDEDYDKLAVAKFNMKEADLDIQEADYTVADNSSVKLNKKSFKVDSRSKLELETKQYENCEVYVEFTGLKKKAYSISKLQELDLGKDSLSDRYDTARYRMNHIDYQPYGNFELFVSSGNLRKRIVNAEGEAQGITERDSYLVNIGYFKKSNGKITIEFPTRGEYTYDDLKVYIVPQNSFDNQAQKLSDNRFTMTGQSANTIAGTVDIKKDGFLYLSLLKHPGWKVYIDGQLAESYKADICFTGVPLRQGKHKIELVYRPIGFNVSLVMFGAGCVMVCVMVIIDWRKLRNEKSLNRHRTL